MVATPERYSEGLRLHFSDRVTVSDDVYGVYPKQSPTTDWSAPNYHDKKMLNLAASLDSFYFHKGNEYCCYLEDYFLSVDDLIKHEENITQEWKNEKDIILSIQSSLKNTSKEQFLVYGIDSYYNETLTMWTIVYFFSKDRSLEKTNRNQPTSFPADPHESPAQL